MTMWADLAELTDPGSAIRARRMELGWTQAELARRTGIGQPEISRIETGRVDATWSTIQRLSMALATDEAPRRSLANGGRTRPRVPTTRWTPKGPIAPILRSDE